ncbi:MAG: hypothetical protein LBU11_06265 [Zoogloeaceae bacterium]|jgi:hypothetical protein|nr:hypothetical protein [Zoogloeaceae bacterium]
MDNYDRYVDEYRRKLKAQSARIAAKQREYDDRIAEWTRQNAFDPEKFNYSARPAAGYPMPESLAAKSRTWGEAFKDTGASLMKGLAGLGGAAGDLYGLAAGNMDNWLSTSAKNAQDHWEDAQSDYLKGKKKERSQRMDEADGVLGKGWTAAKETLTDPSLAVDLLAENAAMLLPAGFAGRGARIAAEAGKLGQKAMRAGRAAKIGQGAAIGTGAGQQGMDVARGVYDANMSMPDEEWDKNPVFSKVVAKYGGDREAAKHELSLSAARWTLPAAAAISVGTQFLPGGRTLERALVGGAAGKAGRFGIPGAVLKGMAGEGAQEALEEGGGQLAGNLISRGIANPNQDIWEGVGESAGLGFAGGALMGGPSGLVNGVVDRSLERSPSQNADPSAPPAPSAGTPAPEAPRPGNPPAQPDTSAGQLAELLEMEQGNQSPPALPHERMGIDPNAGPMSEAAALAVDSGASAVSEAGIGEQETGARSFSEEWRRMPPEERLEIARESGLPEAAARGMADSPQRWEQFRPEYRNAISSVIEERNQSRQESEGLQNRNRSTPASIQQMTSIAANPDYQRLSFSRDFGNGAPVVSGGEIPADQLGRTDVAVGSDGRRIPVQYAVLEAGSVLPSNNVDGTPNRDYGMDYPGTFAVAGNGRIAGLQAAYQRGTAADYAAQLAADAQVTGVDPAVIAGMRNPVLARVMNREDITSDIGDVSNTTGNLVLSPVEQAANDANRIDLSSLSFSEDGSISAQTVRDFVVSMPKSEQGGLLDANGQPTRQAADRLNAAIFVKGYADGGLVRLYAQASDMEARNILSAMAQAAAPMARLEGMGAFDVRRIVTDAAGVAVTARRNGVRLAEAARQLDMSADPLTGDVVAFFARNIRSAKRISEGLLRLARAAYNEAVRPETDMFGQAPAKMTRAELVKLLEEENDGQQKQGGLEQRPGQEPLRQDAGRGGTDGRGQANSLAPETDRAAGQGTGIREQESEDAEVAQASDAAGNAAATQSANAAQTAEDAQSAEVAQQWRRMTPDERLSIARAAGLPETAAKAVAASPQRWEEFRPEYRDVVAFALNEAEFILTRQSEEEAADADRRAADEESGKLTKEQIDREREAFTLSGQSQPKPQGVQQDLLTADGRATVATATGNKSPEKTRQTGNGDSLSPADNETAATRGKPLRHWIDPDAAAALTFDELKAAIREIHAEVANGNYNNTLKADWQRLSHYLSLRPSEIVARLARQYRAVKKTDAYGNPIPLPTAKSLHKRDMASITLGNFAHELRRRQQAGNGKPGLDKGNALSLSLDETQGKDDGAARRGFDAAGQSAARQLESLNRFSPDQVLAYATLIDEFYRTLAGRTGKTVEELWKRFPLDVGAGRDAEGFVQALASQPPKGWKHIRTPLEVLQVWNRTTDAQAVFWTDLQGKLAEDAPELAGYSHSFDRSAADHIRNEHGNAATETPRGQIAITGKDIAQISRIVTQYDAIRTDMKTLQGAPRVAYAKRFTDGVIVYIENASKKKRDLHGVTMWKFSPQSDVNKVLEQVLDSEAQADKAKARQKDGPSDSASSIFSDYESDALTPPTDGSIDSSGEEFNQSAWHGSGKDFDAFSLAFMGTGEGHQAFGWGAYLAGLRELGEAYRRNVKDNGKISAINSRSRELADIMARDSVPGTYRQFRTSAGRNAAREYDLLMTERQNVIDSPGQLYEVNIPEDEDLLDWDRPLGKQPEKVKAALERLFKENRNPNKARGGNAYLHLNRRFTGAEIYHELENVLGSDEKASRLLNQYGIPGHRFLDGQSRDKGEGSHNYVIYDEKAIEILKKYYQEKGNDTRGSFNPSTLSIRLLENADLSTFLHESGHFFLEMYEKAMAEIPANTSITSGIARMRGDFRTILEWAGFEGDFNAWRKQSLAEKRAVHEKFARGFEAYLREGKAPNEKMKGIFAQFKAWLTSIYQRLTDLKVKLTPEVRQAMGRMLSDEMPVMEPQGANDREAVKNIVEAMRSLARAAGTTSNKNQTVTIAKVSNEAAKEAKDKAALDISGYTHTADMFAVRHTLNQHGDATKEAKRGQIAITSDDIAAIPQAVNAPDARVYGVRNNRGQDLIASIKRLPDGTLLVVEEVRTGRRTLALASIRKAPAAKDFDSVARTLLSNAQSDGGNALIIATVEESASASSRSDAGENRPQGASGGGHAQPLSSPVLTPSGWRRMGDLAVGDVLFAANGEETTVEGIYPQGRQSVFQIILEDGGTALCTADHLWTVKEEGEAEWKTVPTSLIREGTRAGRRFELPEVSIMETLK